MRLKGIFLLFLPCVLLASDHPSLFFTPQEVEETKRSRAPQYESENKDVSFCLSGLIYTRPESWKIWVNGRAYAQKQFLDLEVVRVTPSQVFFKKHQNKKTHIFNLSVGTCWHHVNENEGGKPS